MKYLKNNNVKDFVIDVLIDKLDELKGENLTSYGSELSLKLFECEHANGTYYMRTQESKDFIQKHFDDLGEITREIKCQLDEIPYDCFDDPDKFVLLIITEVGSYLIGECQTIEKDYDKEIILTEERITTIKKQLEEQRDCIPTINTI